MCTYRNISHITSIEKWFYEIPSRSVRDDLNSTTVLNFTETRKQTSFDIRRTVSTCIMSKLSWCFSRAEKDEIDTPCDPSPLYYVLVTYLLYYMFSIKITIIV